jgi:hypothetical protein
MFNHTPANQQGFEKNELLLLHINFTFAVLDEAMLKSTHSVFMKFTLRQSSESTTTSFPVFQAVIFLDVSALEFHIQFPSTLAICPDLHSFLYFTM